MPFIPDKKEELQTGMKIPLDVQAQRDLASQTIRQGEMNAPPGADPALYGAMAYKAKFGPQETASVGKFVPDSAPPQIVQQQAVKQQNFLDALKSLGPEARAVMQGPTGIAGYGVNKAMENFSPETANKVGGSVTDAVSRMGGSPELSAGLGTGANFLTMAPGAFLGGIGSDASLAKSLSEAAIKKSQGATRDALIKEAQSAGYVFPPTATGGGNAKALLETFGGGRQALSEAASLKNQQITNAIARKEAGLAPDVALSESSLADARKVLAQPYEEVSSISPIAKSAFDEMQKVKAEANLQWKYYDRSLKPSAKEKAQELTSQANTWEKIINVEAENAGRPDLVQAIKQARVGLAKNYDVERALTQAGDVDAKIIARILDKKGEKGVSEGLKVIGKTADEFPKFTNVNATSQSQGGNAMHILYPAMLAAGGLAGSEHYMGTPYGASLGILGLAGGPARALALSRMMQSVPQYGPGIASQIGGTAGRYAAPFAAEK